MAANYVCDGSSQQAIQNGSFTLKYLRRTSEQNSAFFPSWETFMRDEVLQITTNLVKMGRQNPSALMAISSDSGLNNGLAIKLHITGIEVSEDNKENYLREVNRYLSTAAPDVVQTARVETSRGQQRSQVSEIQFETPPGIVFYKAEPQHKDMFGSLAIVSFGVDLQLDNSVIELCKTLGSIPSALLPGVRIPLTHFSEVTSTFIPNCTIYPSIVPWGFIPVIGVYLMVATPEFPGNVTGLLPFLFVWDVVPYWEVLSRMVEKIRIDPPLANHRRALAEPQMLRAERSAPCAAGDSDASHSIA